MAPRWLLTSYLTNGELQELFFDHEVRVSQNTDLAVYLLYQKQRYLVPKVKAAVDFLVARVQQGKVGSDKTFQRKVLSDPTFLI